MVTGSHRWMCLNYYLHTAGYIIIKIIPSYNSRMYQKIKNYQIFWKTLFFYYSDSFRNYFQSIFILSFKITVYKKQRILTHAWVIKISKWIFCFITHFLNFCLAHNIVRWFSAWKYAQNHEYFILKQYCYSTKCYLSIWCRSLVTYYYYSKPSIL